jgi:hypothetical protein
VGLKSVEKPRNEGREEWKGQEEIRQKEGRKWTINGQGIRIAE